MQTGEKKKQSSDLPFQKGPPRLKGQWQLLPSRAHSSKSSMSHDEGFFILEFQMRSENAPIIKGALGHERRRHWFLYFHPADKSAICLCSALLKAWSHQFYFGGGVHRSVVFFHFHLLSTRQKEKLYLKQMKLEKHSGRPMESKCNRYLKVTSLENKMKLYFLRYLMVG